MNKISKAVIYAFAVAISVLIWSCSDVEHVGPDDEGDTGSENNGDPNGGEGEESATCQLLTFRIEGGRNGFSTNIGFTVNNSTRKVTGSYLAWIDKDDPEVLIPTFTTNGVKVLLNGEEVLSTRTGISFAEEFTLTVVAENGNTRDYAISLLCPQINTELPVMHLEPERAIDSKEVYVDTWLTMYGVDTPTGWWSKAEGQIEVRGRGNSTWGDPDKKPYRLKFPVAYSPLGLDHAVERNWVILANDSDKSFMRNEMGFAFSRVLFDPIEGYHDPKAILFTPSSQFVNVYMNGSYIGIYQMSDHMQRGEGRIAVEKLTSSDGANPELITGGHILETDVHSMNPPERFFSGVRGIQINHKYPDSDNYDPAQYVYIENFITELENVLYGDNFTIRKTAGENISMKKLLPTSL